METEKLDGMRESVANLKKEAESLLDLSNGFPALQQNAKRVDASLRMMQIALGQVTMTPERPPKAEGLR